MRPARMVRESLPYQRVRWVPLHPWDRGRQRVLLRLQGQLDLSDPEGRLMDPEAPADRASQSVTLPSRHRPSCTDRRWSSQRKWQSCRLPESAPC